MTTFSNIKNNRVLVTGGAGFIGSNLCEDLLLGNNDVVCLDNLSTGKVQNIDPLMENKRFSFIRGDIRNLKDCTKALKGVEIVLHQAALGSVPRSIKDPLTTHEVNVNGFLNMLLASKDAGVKRFVYASSSSVYGDSKELPKTEERTGAPKSPYAVSKVTNELYASVFTKVYGLETVGLRYFNVFGKHQDPEGEYAAAIPKFIRLLMSHESPQIHGDGTNSRDFTYIQNVIQMNHLAALTSDPMAIGQVFNTATGERFDLNSMVTLLKKYLSEFDPEIAQVKIQYGPEREGDIPHSLASIEKAKKILNYTPTHSFGEGLKECVKWYREQFL